MTTLNELMNQAPADCRPTVFDPKQAIKDGQKKLAKQLGKKVSELTEAEKEEAFDSLPIRDWDIP